MPSIATSFADSMIEVEKYLDLVKSVQSFGAEDITSLSSTNNSAAVARQVHAITISMRYTGVMAYEGAFLYCYAQYEDAIKKLIEWYLVKIQTKKPRYAHLPIAIRERHVYRCAQILINLKKDQFSHLTEHQILSSLSSCLPGGLGYRLIPEAFTSSENNFRSKVLEEHFGYLGIPKIIEKTIVNQPLQLYFNSRIKTYVDTKTRTRLGEFVDDRNSIIHRNASYSSPGETQVRECARFFSALVTSLERTLVKTARAIQ